MSAEPDRLDPSTPVRDAVLPRIFLKEPGWRIAVKGDSQREFCYTTAPGQDHYHRLGAGEIYFFRGDEKICLPCADRYGLLEFQPRPLRESIAQPRLEAGEVDTIDLA
ncbi:MAG: hypothetical protein U0800_18115 [Isosphaeraceae bacterium]